jgi:cytochrome c oxidase subunit 1
MGIYRLDIGWFWSVPQVYLLVVPAAGVALEIVPVLARTRFRIHAVALIVLGLLGVVGIGAWAQVPQTFDDLLYVAIGIAPVLPALALLGLSADTLRGGRPVFKAPLLFAMGTLLMILLGAVAGALQVIDPLDLHGTVWEAGQMHLLLLGAGTLGGFGALWWWAPKLWGTRLSEGAGVLTFLAVFLGTLLLAVPDLVNGMANDLPLGRTTFDDGGSVKALNGLSAAGGILVAVGALIAVLALLASARRRGRAAEDPWGGQTLEWNPAALASEEVPV